MGLSFWQIAIVAILVVLLFGRGKISELMGDVARGIKSFKRGMTDDDVAAAPKTPLESSKVKDEPTQS
ncbi:MAG: twin-arginine translocase TatA/TatE family subunit [Alphaproteobacteria bacterium]